ncbi:DUF1761 domain-containing protein [Mesobacterium pallidum]|uniref:DUF1761 domain-containing protein n=1 Tax=Mesobacterium pallidum TaxID=2872037 RepID=UPI001EE254D5|nr:DUF1761 domain-containing protein [Mesobacterium pallidum]
MELINVLVAALAAWLFGAAWYMTLAKPWMEAAGVEVGPDGKPQGGQGALPFILSALAMVLVAGMMRHMLSMAGITGIGKSALTGLGIGLFFISPWIMINNAYPGRPFKLTLIDGGYAVFGCMIIGIVLALF